MSNLKWYVGAQNDILYIIDKPPRPSNDDINPDRDVEVIATIAAANGGHRIESERANLIAAAPDLLKELEHLVRLVGPALENGADIPGLATVNGAVAAIKKAKGVTT